MIGDTFVVDGVVHIVDLLPGDKLRDANSDWSTAMGFAGGMEEAMPLISRMSGGVSDVAKYKATGFKEFPPELRGSVEAIGDLVFAQSPTDMAMIGNQVSVPNGAYLDPDYALKLTHAVAQAYPERALFGGGVDPMMGGGLSAALDSIEHQIRDLRARSMKFYPLAWRCDDEKLAYPMYEKCRSLGVKVIQVHKNVPLFLENVELLQPIDLQAAARDFPDLTFIMHHPMRLYFEETVSIVQRFPNIYLLISPVVQFALLKPRLAQEMLGALLEQVGSDKLIYGSEGPIAGNPTKWIEAFMKLEIAEDLRDGYGYPQITQEDKDKILGLNFARLFNIDVAAKKRELAALPAGR